MSDGSLSQDEIDALLQGTDTISMDTDLGFGSGDSDFSDKDKELIRNLLDSVVESQSSNLSMLTGQTATMGRPTVSVKSRDQLIRELKSSLVEIKMDFTEGVSGEHLTYFDEATALQIAGMMLGQDGVELNEMALSTLGEAVSNILGPSTTALGNKINATVKTSPPNYQHVNKDAVNLPSGDSLLVVDYPLTISGQSSKMIDVYSLPLAREIGSLISRFEVGSDSDGLMDAGLDLNMGGDDVGGLFPMEALTGPGGNAGNMGGNMGQMGGMGNMGGQMGGMGNMGQMGGMGNMGQMGGMGNMGQMGGQMGNMGQMGGMGNMGQMGQMGGMGNMGQMGGMGNMGQMGGMPPMMGGHLAPPNVQSVNFPNLQPGGPSYEQGNIGLLMDVYMEMTVELGRTRKLIKDILGIGEGTIIELDKLAGEPVDILVNHKLIAKGEVVVIDENFGVRVTEIVSPMERMGDLT